MALVTNTISRTTMVSRTVIWSFSITGGAPVANTTVSSPMKRSVTYFVTPSIASMILTALLWSNLLMKFMVIPESSSDLSAALSKSMKSLAHNHHRLEPNNSPLFIFFLPLVMSSRTTSLFITASQTALSEANDITILCNNSRHQMFSLSYIISKWWNSRQL